MSVKVLAFTVAAPPGEPAHEGLGQVGPPRIDRYPKQFRAAAKATGVDEAWLRAIAHAESGFDADAVSPKGAQGVMQLMPADQSRVRRASTRSRRAVDRWRARGICAR